MEPSPPRPLLAVPNVIAHPSTASVPTTGDSETTGSRARGPLNSKSVRISSHCITSPVMLPIAIVFNVCSEIVMITVV